MKSIEYEVIITLSPPTAAAITTTTPITTTTTPITTTTTTTTIAASPTTSSTQCNKLRGGKIRPNRLYICRIYMKKISTKSDCRKFVRKLKAMDDNARSDIRFELKQVGHDRQRPMIIAKVNQQAVEMVSHIYSIRIFL